MDLLRGFAQQQPGPLPPCGSESGLLLLSLHLAHLRAWFGAMALAWLWAGFSSLPAIAAFCRELKGAVEQILQHHSPDCSFGCWRRESTGRPTSTATVAPWASSHLPAGQSSWVSVSWWGGGWPAPLHSGLSAVGLPFPGLQQPSAYVPSTSGGLLLGFRHSFCADTLITHTATCLIIMTSDLSQD